MNRLAAFQLYPLRRVLNLLAIAVVATCAMWIAASLFRPAGHPLSAAGSAPPASAAADSPVGAALRGRPLAAADSPVGAALRGRPLAAAPDSPVGAALRGRPLAIGPAANLVPDVEPQFDALPARGDPLGVWVTYTTFGGPNHYQGLARADFAEAGGRSVPYLFLSRGGGSGQAEIVVVRMGSKAGRSGPLMHSNRLPPAGDPRDVPPPDQDREVARLFVPWHHTGGIQVADDVLVVPVERSLDAALTDGRSDGGLVLVDVGAPQRPTLLRTLYTFADRTGAEVPIGRVGVAGVARIPRGTYAGRYLFALSGSGGHFRHGRVVWFGVSNTGSLRTTTAVRLLKEWHAEQMSPMSDWCGRCEWTATPHGDRKVAPTYEWQMLNLLGDAAKGALYLAGASNATNGPDRARSNVLRLFKVLWDGSGEDLSLAYAGREKVLAMDGPRMGDLDGMSGLYVGPGGELVLYTGDHYVDGPGGCVPLGEFGAAIRR